MTDEHKARKSMKLNHADYPTPEFEEPSTNRFDESCHIAISAPCFCDTKFSVFGGLMIEDLAERFASELGPVAARGRRD